MAAIPTTVKMFLTTNRFQVVVVYDTVGPTSPTTVSIVPVMSITNLFTKDQMPTTQNSFVSLRSMCVTTIVTASSTKCGKVPCCFFDALTVTVQTLIVATTTNTSSAFATTVNTNMCITVPTWHTCSTVAVQPTDTQDTVGSLLMVVFRLTVPDPTSIVTRKSILPKIRIVLKVVVQR